MAEMLPSASSAVDELARLVLSACSRSAASPPRTLPTTMWIRAVSPGVTHEVADRHRPAVDPPRLEANAIGPLDAKLQLALNGDNAFILG